MRLKLTYVIYLLLWSTLLCAYPQKDFIPIDSLVKLLKNKASSGDKRAYRDLGYLIDNKENSAAILKILDEISLVPKSIFTFNEKTSKQDFLDYFYHYQTKIKFSQLYDAYILEDFEKEKLPFKTLPKEKKDNSSINEQKKVLHQLDFFINAKNADSAAVYVGKLRFFSSKETYKTVLSLVQNKEIQHNKNFRKTNFYRQLVEVLSDYSTKESFDAILYLIDNELLAPSLSAFPLAKITNVFSAHEGSDAMITKRYQHYMDSLKTLEALKTFGYERYGHFQRNYFEEDVDFFAALATTAAATDSYWWIKTNAINDMMLTHHPRALFYLTAQFYKERNQIKGFSSKHYFQILQNWVNEKIEVPDANGNLTSEPNDLVAKKNFLRYWMQHWSDYEWDDFLYIFVNKQEKLAQKENYERLFRRLTSTNDSVAVQSFRELTEGEPSEIVKLANKYRTLLRNINPNLPNFKSKILETLSFFTDFCRQQNIEYQPSAKELNLFSILLSPLSPSERYLVENQVIQQVQISQITKLEYWAILNESNNAAAYSVSRILDKWYSSHFGEVLNDNRQLHLYLKKMALFTQLGVTGTCTMYYKKFEIKDENVRAKLSKIAFIENEESLNLAINQILNPVIPKDKNQSQTPNNTSENPNLSNLVASLKTADYTTIEAVNNVLQSSNYKAEYRETCLNSLAKIPDVEDIFLLKIQPKLSVKNGDLSYFNNIKLGAKDLDHFPRIFEVDDAEKLFEFIQARSKDFTLNELGSLYNNLFRSLWFTNYINSGVFTKQQALDIKDLLEKYLNESDLMSEFEEQATQRNLVQLDNIGRPLLDKLTNIYSMSSDDDTKSKVFAEVIARINYEDLGIVIPFLTQIGEINGHSSITFLNEDFGLPIFDLSSSEARDEFVQNHAKLSEIDFYKFYLKKFGLDFLRDNGDLDVEKIYHILKYDLVTPFTSASGSKRDFHVYGLIKTLELKYVTRLGFHYKLNESQTFYSYNSGKRVEAWLKYLEDNKIFIPENEEPKSFNQ